MPWSKLADVPRSVAVHQEVPLTLAQANWVAQVADSIKAEGKVESPWAVAWAQFGRLFVIQGGRWVRRKTRAQEATATMAVTKTEDGQQFAASAYAYVPDPESPSTWKIRLEETPGKVTKAQLGRAAAAFSPGGFRGQKVEIPSADVVKVKAKIRAGYRKLEVAPEDIPASVREARGTASYQNEARVQELFGVGDVEALGDGDYRIDIVSRGLTADASRYYTEGALQAAVQEGVYDNAKMFLNHADPADEGRRGHRDMKEWAGTIKPGSAQFVGGTIQAIAHAHAQEALAFLNDPVAKRAVGLSHDSDITYYSGRINGRAAQVVERIKRCHSVDFVPAGNAFGRVLEAAPEEEAIDMADLEGLTEDVLQEARPDLVQAIEARVQEAAKTSASEGLETRIAAAKTEAVEEYKRVQEAEAQKPPAPKPETPAENVDARIKEAATAATAPLQAEIKELRENAQRRDVAEIVAGLVAKEQNLTAASKARVVEGLSGQLLAAAEIGVRVQEACERERQHELDLMKEFGAGTRVKGLGPTTETQTTEVKEAYQRTVEDRMRADGIGEDTIKQFMAARP